VTEPQTIGRQAVVLTSWGGRLVHGRANSRTEIWNNTCTTPQFCWSRHTRGGRYGRDRVAEADAIAASFSWRLCCCWWTCQSNVVITQKLEGLLNKYMQQHSGRAQLAISLSGSNSVKSEVLQNSTLFFSQHCGFCCVYETQHCWAKESVSVSAIVPLCRTVVYGHFARLLVTVDSGLWLTKQVCSMSDCSLTTAKW
jgi:hypothetical protein